MKPKLILMGAGGHCKVILDLLMQTKEYSVVGIIGLKEHVGEKLAGISVIGTDQDLSQLFKKGIKHCFIAVGSVGNPKGRLKLYQLAQKAGFKFPNLIHPSALVSPHASMGEGNFIGAGAIINTHAELGNQCIVNTAAIVEHDCKIEDFVHLSPRVVLSGGVSIGACTHIGIGTAVVQNLKIGANSIVGAGSVVTKNISSNVVAYGNPCKEKKNV